MKSMGIEDPVIRAFIHRLDKGELNGKLNFELSKLSYGQLLRVSEILARRVEEKQE